MSTDARAIVDQYRDLPIIEVGRILVEAGHCGTDYMRPARCIAAYWQHQQSRIAKGEISRGCEDSHCQPWTNKRGLEMCSRSGLVCVGHCSGHSVEHAEAIQ